MDEATRLLQQAPFDRITISMLCRVLEDSWIAIAGCADSRAEKVRRLNLSDGILALANRGERDPEALKTYAVGRAQTLIGPASL